MSTCPAGHTSASSDFCDVCGMRIGVPAGVPAAPRADFPPEAQPSADTGATGPARPCPRCGAARSGRFCESCGLDFETAGTPAASVAASAAPGGEAGSGDRSIEGVNIPPSGTRPGQPPARPALAGTGPAPAATKPAAWTAMVASDHAYFKNVVAAGGPDAAAVEFPGYTPERRFRLAGLEMRIGRRSVSRGLEPEIDLTGPPTDPGISRLHAVLFAEPDGSWTILDPGSENGTLVNGREITAGVRLSLHDGDRIHLGAWTVITIQAG
jgi:FHA domain-containing protein